MTSTLSVYRDGEQTVFKFDATKSLVLSHIPFKESTGLTIKENVEHVTIEGFHVVNIGEWAWKIIQRIIQWSIKWSLFKSKGYRI